MEKENVKIYEGINNLYLYKTDNGGRWYKVADLDCNKELIEQFFAIVEYENLKPLRETRRTKFYYISKRYF